jgi:hypothetical protein
LHYITQTQKLKGISASIHLTANTHPSNNIYTITIVLLNSNSNQIKMSSATKYSTEKQMRSVSEQTWANILSAAKPTKQTNKSRPFILANDIGSILVQLALEKKYKTELTKKQKQTSRPIAPTQAPTQAPALAPTLAQSSTQAPTQVQTPQNKTTNENKNPLSKVELRKRKQKNRMETDEKCLHEIAKIVNLPISKEEQEKRITEIICRKSAHKGK